MNIFTYGSLMIPAVMRVAAGRSYPHHQALLQDYARYRLRGASYPGLTHEKGAVTQGVVYLGLGSAAVERLDYFEGDWYRRERVELEDETGNLLRAETYVVTPASRRLLTPHAWDFEAFKDEDLSRFRQQFLGFRRIRGD